MISARVLSQSIYALLLALAGTTASAAESSRAANSARPLPGQIIIDPEHPHWLKRHGGGHLFICGPGDPEEFLYLGPRNPDGTRAGDQRQRIDQLIEHGGNSIYMQIVRTHGGDAKSDRTHNPFVDSDPAKGVDARILEQWEQWFARMDAHGILIYLFFYDDGARPWNTGDTVGPGEQAFVETIVRRFKHHRNLIWVVGEESEERYSHDRVNALAELIRRADNHGHIIGNHHLRGTHFKAWRPGSALSHYSMQLNLPAGEAHAGALEARRNAEGRYQVIWSENTTMLTDVDGMRRHAWSVAMAGLMPMLLRMDIASTPVEALQQCRHLQRFFEATDFHTLEPHDELAYGETKYVLADPGRSYLGYTDRPEGGLGFKALPAGACDVTWVDCVTGRTTTEQHRLAGPGEHAFQRPAGFGAECAAWVRFPDVARQTRAAVAGGGSAASPAGSRSNRAPRGEDRWVAVAAGKSAYVQLAFLDDDGPGPYTYTIVRPPRNGTLSGTDNDRTYQPRGGFTGNDSFTWKVSDGQAESEPATVRIEVTAAAAEGPSPPGGYFPPPESQGGWRKREKPDEVRRVAGMDPEKLDAVREWLLASDQRNFAAVVIRRGHIALEVERGNSAKTDARRVASVSKAVCATVLAIASELSQQGNTPRRMKFDDPAFDFIPWAQPLSDPRKANITVRQLFNHTSGICPEATGAKNDGTWEYILGHTGDPRTVQLAFDPGTASGYSSHALHHASLVCETVTGVPYDQFAIRHLFEPLGCEHWWFQFYEGGEKYGRHPSHGMGMPARDLARIAYCMLRGGTWNGGQVIPRWFVEQTAVPSHSLVGVKELRFKRAAESFSHGWELPAATGLPAAWSEHIPADARYKPGSGGQLIAFVPSLDLVVTRQTGGSGQWKYEEYLGRVCAAVVR